MGSVIVAGLLLGLLVVTVVHRRRERVEWARLADAQRAGIGQVIEELTSLRSALIAVGAAERPPQLPPAPPSARDEPSSTKPSLSRTVPAPLRSEPLSVPVEDAVQRAMRRIERHARVAPEVAARWEQRLRALGDELGLAADAEPTDAQIAEVIRELYEAEADLKDARPAPPLEATLASAVSPVAVRIAQAMVRADDADGETTLRRDGDRPATLPRPNADGDAEDGRDTGEDMTRVYSRKPGEAGARIPGVEAKPKPSTVPPPDRPPRPVDDPLAGVEPERPESSAKRTAESFRLRRTLFNGLAGVSESDQDEGGGPRLPGVPP
jgi:hypothetical protein